VSRGPRGRGLFAPIFKWIQGHGSAHLSSLVSRHLVSPDRRISPSLHAAAPPVYSYDDIGAKPIHHSLRSTGHENIAPMLSAAARTWYRPGMLASSKQTRCQESIDPQGNRPMAGRPGQNVARSHPSFLQITWCEVESLPPEIYNWTCLRAPPPGGESTQDPSANHSFLIA